MQNSIVDKLYGSIKKNRFSLPKTRECFFHEHIHECRKCGKLLANIPDQKGTFPVVQVVRLHPNSLHSQNITKEQSPRHMEFLSDRARHCLHRRYYTDPSSGIGTDLQKYLESRSIRSNLLQYEPGSQEYQVATMREVEKFYEKKFEQGNVEVLDRRVEGRDFVWKVRFPNGKVKEVRYGN